MSFVSAVPEKLPELQKPQLRAANDTSIPVYKIGCQISVNFGIERVYTFGFMTAAVSAATFVAEFLRKISLMIDMQCLCVIDNSSFLSTGGTMRAADQIFLITHISSNLQSARDGKYFVDIRTCEEFQAFSVLPSGYTVILFPRVTHGIMSRNQQVFSCPRRLIPAESAATKRELEELVYRGILTPSSSSWTSPIHLVERDGGESFGLVGCYQRLNAIAVSDVYSVLHIYTFADRLVSKYSYLYILL